MKFSLFAVPAFIAGALAAPAISQEKRQVGQVVSIVEGLVSDITSLTGKINATTVGVGAAGVSAQVTVDIQDTLDTVVSTIEGVVSATGAISLVDNVAGETETYVAGLLSTVIEELNGTLGNVETLVGLDAITSQVTGITSQLGGLLNILQGLGLQNILSTVTGLLNILPVGQVTGLISGLGLPLKQ
ncbi:hypothetical protein M409DRAFT_52006 [Zasmidium cellare ATCC 36951]|uniref:Uncharacterized protein n=1 Tax=Zasmidium cellare ATCC 36951 TaxID=1080233 RepID=A0A6A6CT47_ZASCE|nr:uncharacterized protein M409DRAFT_52006 [Zasmidium cellare ATCC 36951]KAF2170271.1 hypothetical protein M409DRAFT_52006 [Zasmidium cellare ATCC 36951]